MDFLFQYGLFLAKTLTWVVAVLIVLVAFAGIAVRSKGSSKEGFIEITHFNEKLKEYEETLNAFLLPKNEFKAFQKQTEPSEEGSKKRLVKKFKFRKKADQDLAKKPQKKRVFVVKFEGDVKASGVEELTNCITAILTCARPECDEVVIQIESPGGMVHAYGLAAAQLERFKAAGITLVATIDKVAASGGYLMAVTADKIISSPFAVVGSIGVVAQIPNFNRFLKKNDVDVELHTAGEFKRTLTLFGENTDDAREKFKEELEETHDLFKEFVGKYRPSLQLNEVATGEHWFGTKALKLNLVDEVMTSDEYLVQSSKESDVYLVNYEVKKSVSEKLGDFMQALILRSGKLRLPESDSAKLL